MLHRQLVKLEFGTSSNTLIVKKESYFCASANFVLFFFIVLMQVRNFKWWNKLAVRVLQIM